MISLGISGFFATETDEFLPGVKRRFNHDAAAALLIDGRLVAATEEERLNRVKHTNLFPSQAIRWCLSQAGVSLRDVDSVNFFWEESWLDFGLAVKTSENPTLSFAPIRETVQSRIEEASGDALQSLPLQFQPHHACHAVAAFHDSGFSSSLVLVADGNGENTSLSLFDFDGQSYSLLDSFDVPSSLGHLYATGTKLVGFSDFDEYKVMGLAPYGDAGEFREMLGDLYELLPEGRYTLSAGQLASHMLERGFPVRSSGHPLEVIHSNFAAALQEALERIILHLLSYWAEQGYESLCFSGGVAHNSTLNGLIASSGLFKTFFVHPASHDGGTSLGAALLGTPDGCASAKPLEDVFWGSRLGSTAEIVGEVERWGRLFRFQEIADPAATAAELLAEGQVLGWAQGRSEFGPRALGGRSILADARPESNKQHVNKIIKNRETYRPFAPAALAEDAQEHFRLPSADVDLRFMGLTLPVREDSRELLGAVTHVDGSARLQVVEQGNPLHDLLVAFKRLTGVGVVLNTSFNNKAEPIVDSARDCLRTLATTGLNIAIIGNVMVTKHGDPLTWMVGQRIVLPPLVHLVSTWNSGHVERHTLGFRDTPSSHEIVSTGVVDTVRGGYIPKDLKADTHLASELLSLWTARLIDINPVLSHNSILSPVSGKE